MILLWREFHNCHLLLYILFQSFINGTSPISNYDFIPYRRTTGSMSSCGSSGMTLDWHIKSIQMTLWTWTPQCWTPSGNLTCSLQMKREQTFTRSQQTTNCFGYSRMEMSSTASGDLFLKLWIWLNNAPGCTSIRHNPSCMVCQVANWTYELQSKPLSIWSNNVFVSLQFSSVVIVLSSTHCEWVHVKQ